MRRKFKVVAIAGSMRYYKRMLRLASDLTEQGFIVLMPFQVVPNDDDTQRIIEEMPMQRIAMADFVFLVGKHVGDDVNKEVEFAIQSGKPIRHDPAA